MQLISTVETEKNFYGGILTRLIVVVRELMTQKLERKQQKLNDYTERLQRLRSLLNELRSDRLQIETDLQKRTRLEETKDELTRSNETLDCEILVGSFFSVVHSGSYVFTITCCGVWMLFYVNEGRINVLLWYCPVGAYVGLPLGVEGSPGGKWLRVVRGRQSPPSWHPLVAGGSASEQARLGQSSVELAKTLLDQTIGSPSERRRVAIDWATSRSGCDGTG